MRYIGGKARIAKEITPYILQTNPKVVYEPFCGALNVTIELLKQDPKLTIIASDAHVDLIDLWCAVQQGWIPPHTLSRDEYEILKTSPSSPLRTFAGYGCSFSGKWFGGFAEDSSGRNYCGNAKNSIMKNIDIIKKIHFRHGHYAEQIFVAGAVVYCDPPYADTTKPGVRATFDTEAFWQWVSSLPNTCYVSEYSSPIDIEVVWEKTVRTDMNTKNGKDLRTEKLFLHRP